MNKRAFEMQFHWIFVLIIGAVILTFFFSVVQKQKTLSQQKISLSLSTDFDAVFTSALESKGTAQPMQFPQLETKFVCTKTCDCFYEIEGSRPTQFNDKVIFPSKNYKNVKAFAWTLDWKQPFRIANFLYILHPNTRYYFVYDENNPESLKLAEQVNRTLPQELPVTIVSQDNLEALSPKTEKAVFAFLYTNGHSPSRFKEPRLIEFTSETEAVLENNRHLSYLGVQPLLAIVFSEDPQFYECGMKQAMLRLRTLAELFKQRGDALNKYYSDPAVNKPFCFYGDINDPSNELTKLAEIAKVLSASTTVYDTARFNEFKELSKTLEGKNQQLVDNSCADMY